MDQPGPHQAAALEFIDFLNASPSPFHAVANCARMLREAGFVELDEGERFRVGLGDKCFLKKGQTTLFAFAVGQKWEPGEAGFSMLATHTDSCCLRMKPISKREAEGFLQLGVSPYGGGRWTTWFDRDLSLAGQLILRQADGSGLEQKLIDLRRPILHIPSLAIHLDDTPDNKTEFNLEQHLTPLFACQCQKSSGNDGAEGASATHEAVPITSTTANCSSSTAREHHASLLLALAREAECRPSEIVDMDLFLYDTQPAVLSGLNREFISGARLDNLVSTFCAIRALVDGLAGEEGGKSLGQERNIRLVACFDHEEVGSESCQGAKSAVTEWLLRRLCAGSEDACAFERSIGHSFLISADKAHAAHPNYPEKHDECHRPRFGAGPVVKFNLSTLRFLSTAMTQAVMKLIGERAGVPLQKYTFRNDWVCGGTIGPILAAGLGIQTVDIGCQPQLAMHSIRELGDSAGIHQSIQLFKAFFKELPSVLANVRKAE